MTPTSLRNDFFETTEVIHGVEKLFDGVSDIVFFIKDTQGRYMAVNDTLAVRCGLANKEAVIGRRADELFPPPLGEAFARQDLAILAGGPGFRDHLELHLYPGGKSGWCLTYKEAILSKRGGVAGVCGISRDLHSPGGQDGDFPALSAAIEHIHQHFDEPLRLTTLANIAGMSVYQFDQRIRSLFRVTAGQFLVKVRIEAACKRLTRTNDPIATIALDCGYSDQSAFSRQFRQVVGISPLAYRRKPAAG
jgi:AraC-like DNA-binding protein